MGLYINNEIVQSEFLSIKVLESLNSKLTELRNLEHQFTAEKDRLPTEFDELLNANEYLTKKQNELKSLLSDVNFTELKTS